jgi:hypothetical protein
MCESTFTEGSKWYTSYNPNSYYKSSLYTFTTKNIINKHNCVGFLVPENKKDYLYCVSKSKNKNNILGHSITLFEDEDVDEGQWEADTRDNFIFSNYYNWYNSDQLFIRKICKKDM